VHALGAIGNVADPEPVFLENPGEETRRGFFFLNLGFPGKKGKTMKIKIKTVKPRNVLVAVTKLRGGAGAHQSELSPRVARRAGKQRLHQLLAGRLKEDS